MLAAGKAIACRFTAPKLSHGPKCPKELQHLTRQKPLIFKKLDAFY